MNKKVIVRKYKEEGEEWEEVSLQDAIDRLSAYWIPSTIESMLMDEGLTLWNPFAEYKAVYKDSL